jgi:malate permease and related proteins
MTNLTLLFVCLLIGIILRRVEIFQKNAFLVLNSFIIYVCMPALNLLYTTEIHFERSLLFPFLMPYTIFFFSFIFFRIIAPIFHFDRATTGALILTAGISSISFVGFPIFELLYGKEGLKVGILMSQAGCFVIVGTLGIIIASFYSDSEPSYQKIVKNVATFPPFIAFCIALILNFSSFHFPDLAKEILQKLGSPFSVIALISIGLQINFNKEMFTNKALYVGLFYKLFLAPLLIFTIYILFLGENTWLGKISVLGAGLGSMNVAAIVAINHNLNPKLASLMIGVGIPLSLITVAILSQIL